VRLISYVVGGRFVSAHLMALTVLVLLLSGCAQTPVEKTKRALALHDEASALYLAKDCEGALKAYQTVIERYPASAEAWYRVGNCYARLKRHGAAVAAYREALQLQPDYSKAWHNLVYVESKALIETLAQMDERLTEADPARIQVSKLLRRLLSVDAAPYLVSEVDDARISVRP